MTEVSATSKVGFEEDTADQSPDTSDRPSTQAKPRRSTMSEYAEQNPIKAAVQGFVGFFLFIVCVGGLAWGLVSGVNFLTGGALDESDDDRRLFHVIAKSNIFP